jgi:hypothetical protein
MTVRNNRKNISRRMDIPLFPKPSIRMAPLISTGKHPRSDGISLSTCPEALVVSSIVAAMEVCCIIQVHNIRHQRIVRALRMFGGSVASEGQVSVCERERESRGRTS